MKRIAQYLFRKPKFGAKFLFLVSVLVFIFGTVLVWMDVNDEINADLSESSHLIEKEVSSFWHKLEAVANNRSFLTNLSFNVNLAATNYLDNFVDQSNINSHIFVYDAEKRYFGKNERNNLNRFAFKLKELNLGPKYYSWNFVEHDKERYIERFKELSATDKHVGYLRVLIPLKELQNKVFAKQEGLAHLSTEESKYSYSRCTLNAVTDLLICVPIGFNTVLAKSGSLLAFVFLFWFFLVFVIANYIRSKLAQARAQTLVELSSQVSHDIQSPLLALKVATKGLSQMPEDQRLMLQRSIERIEDIVNDLRNKRDSNLENSNKMEHHLLFGLVSSILSEKRLQFKYRNIKLEFFCEESLHNSFVRLNQKDFKRVLSNLINNAVEAIPDVGKVSICLEQKDEFWVLILEDDGIGISEFELKDIFKKGVSFRKDKGQGLGLYHAAKMARNWEAELLVESAEHVGTRVELHIPKAQSPSWFPKTKTIEKSTEIVIIDDDQNIHEMWMKRFLDLGFTNSISHFYHVQSAEEYLSETKSDNLVFLVDYELIHSSKNGIDFILNNQLHDRSVLVTARYDDEKILSTCSYFQIPLLPKLLMNEFELLRLESTEEGKNTIAGFTIFASGVKEKRLSSDQHVLIDDDPLVRKLWDMSAKSKGVDLVVFSSAQDFIENQGRIHQNAKFYIDVDLGTEVSGIQWAKKISNLGYKNLNLTTGFEDIELAKYPWILKTFSKEPPFATFS